MANRNATSTSDGGACLAQTTNVQLCLSHIGHVIGHAESASAAIFAEINIINQTIYTNTSQTPLPLPLPIPTRQARWCMTFVLAYVIVCHHHVVINNDDKNGPTIQSRGHPQKPHAHVLKLVDSSVQSRDSRPQDSLRKQYQNSRPDKWPCPHDVM